MEFRYKQEIHLQFYWLQLTDSFLNLQISFASTCIFTHVRNTTDGFLLVTHKLAKDSFKYKKSFNNHFGNTSLNFNKNDTTADEDDKIVKYCSGRQKPKSL